MTVTMFFFESAATAYIQAAGNPSPWSQARSRALLFFALAVASLGYAFYGDALECISEQGWQLLGVAVQELAAEQAVDKAQKSMLKWE